VAVMVALKMLEQSFTTLQQQEQQILEVVVVVLVMHKQERLAVLA
jgi:hypothetical protein